MSTQENSHLLHFHGRGALNILNKRIQDKLAKGEIERSPNGNGYRVVPGKSKRVDASKSETQP